MSKTQIQQSLDILVDELVANDELRQQFFQHPYATMRDAAEWGIPLTDREVEGLCVGQAPIWILVMDALNKRFPLAA